MIDSSGIRAVCKRCGKSVQADKFVLDSVYRMMVCPFCVKERKDKINAERFSQERDKEEKERLEELKTRPAGWDAEDEYLERLSRKKEQVKVDFERIDKERIKCSCPKCRYRFVYNTISRSPAACPYCGAKITASGFDY